LQTILNYATIRYSVNLEPLHFILKPQWWRIKRRPKTESSQPLKALRQTSMLLRSTGQNPAPRGRYPRCFSRLQRDSLIVVGA